MLLRDISLYLKTDEFESSEFQFRSRYICNFLRRQIVPLRFRTNGFGSIAVQGCRSPRDGCPVTGTNVAIPSVAFDEKAYESLEPEDLEEFFISMLFEGLEKCANYHEIPLAELRSGIDLFRRGGCVNEWTFLRKLLRPVGLHASLLCRMNSEKFVLRLRLERKGQVVFEERILETKPDETIFSCQFKDFVTDGESIFVRDKFGDTLCSVRLEEGKWELNGGSSSRVGAKYGKTSFP